MWCCSHHHQSHNLQFAAPHGAGLPVCHAGDPGLTHTIPHISSGHLVVQHHPWHMSRYYFSNENPGIYWYDYIFCRKLGLGLCCPEHSKLHFIVNCACNSNTKKKEEIKQIIIFFHNDLLSRDLDCNLSCLNFAIQHYWDKIHIHEISQNIVLFKFQMF